MSDPDDQEMLENEIQQNTEALGDPKPDKLRKPRSQKQIESTAKMLLARAQKNEKMAEEKAKRELELEKQRDVIKEKLEKKIIQKVIKVKTTNHNLKKAMESIMEDDEDAMEVAHMVKEKEPILLKKKQPVVVTKEPVKPVKSALVSTPAPVKNELYNIVFK